eukprot:1158516-Pelagomonas_calceolata.AAC.3
MGGHLNALKIGCWGRNAEFEQREEQCKRCTLNEQILYFIYVSYMRCCLLGFCTFINSSNLGSNDFQPTSCMDGCVLMRNGEIQVLKIGGAHRSRSCTPILRVRGCAWLCDRAIQQEVRVSGTPPLTPCPSGEASTNKVLIYTATQAARAAAAVAAATARKRTAKKRVVRKLHMAGKHGKGSMEREAMTEWQ